MEGENMDRLLFIARNDILSGNSSTGNKVYSQYRFFTRHFDTYLISQTDKKIILTHQFKSEVVKECDVRNRVLIDANEICVRVARDNNIKFVYVRYPKSNPVFLGTLKKLCEHGCRIIIEFPTFPYDKEIDVFCNDYRDRIIFYVDKLFRNKLKHYTFAAATFSEHSSIFDIPAFQIYNGVFVDEIKQRLPVESNDIHVIAVAQMQRSHGYDRFLVGLMHYYNQKRDKKVILHLVGDGPEKLHLEKIVNENKLHNSVIFHGYCTGSDLDDLYNNCSLALECLALHRSGVEMSSSLKSREYLSKGLPIVTSAKIDIVEEGFPYVYRVDSTEEPIIIEQVIEYHNTIYSNSQKDVVDCIREYAKIHCDINNTMMPVKERFYV